MPINYKRYHPDWKDIIRPQALKKANYRCQNCGVPNRTLIVRNSDGSFVECDDLVLKHCKVTGEKPIRVILTISHTNHLVIDNRPENLKALCQYCHLNHDAEHKREMKRAAKLTNFEELKHRLNEPGAETLLPHVFAVYRAKRNTAKHLESIAKRRNVKGYTSEYDKQVQDLYQVYRKQATYLLKWACDVLADAYNMPDPLEFYEEYYASELKQIGTQI